MAVNAAGWLQVLNPAVLSWLGHVRHVLFDFDGTLSVLRQGWEGVMVPLMVEMICGEGARQLEVEREVCAYVDRSTGILTIEQMAWLVEAVRRYGLAREVKTAAAYKALYIERLMAPVRARLAGLARGDVSAEEQTIAGARSFVESLAERGVTLYLASGTDHHDVVREAQALGLARFFKGGIYGALDENRANDKGYIIERILNAQRLRGPELAVVGDGPVEMRHAVARGAIGLGVASDEVVRQGWNPRKVRRLSEAGADILVCDFGHYSTLLDILMGELPTL